MGKASSPVALTIAGSDSCGGAGIQADLKAFTVLGVYGMTVLTAITAQNTRGVQAASELPLDLVRKQFQSVTSDIAPDAIKTGMLASIGMIELVAELLASTSCPYVCDPVMVAKSGDPLIAPHAIAVVRSRLLPRATVLTPNRFEVQHLLGESARVETIEQAKDAAKRLHALGPKYVVIKGVETGETVTDILYDGRTCKEIDAPRQPSGRSHGSGCTFSAAIAAELAKGSPVLAAIQTARNLINHAIAQSFTGGQGTRPVNVLGWK